MFLGCFFFMIKFNGALLRPDVPRSVKLKSALSKVNTDNRQRPLEYFEHTGYTLNPETNYLQEDLDNLKTFTDKNLMVINEKKTLIMKFNFRKTMDFPPIFKFNNGPMHSIVFSPCGIHATKGI